MIFLYSKVLKFCKNILLKAEIVWLPSSNSVILFKMDSYYSKEKVSQKPQDDQLTKVKSSKPGNRVTNKVRKRCRNWYRDPLNPPALEIEMTFMVLKSRISFYLALWPTFRYITIQYSIKKNKKTQKSRAWLLLLSPYHISAI